MQVKDVMTHGAECTRPTATLDTVAERMKDLNVGALPVCDDGRLVGMITDRDIAVRATAMALDPAVTTVEGVMTPEIHFCYDDQAVGEAARIMQEKQIRRLLVLDRSKRLVGIVSLGDLAVETHNDALSGETLERVSEPAHPH